MTQTRFVLAVHCHQPVGNFRWVLEEAYERAYRPFVEALRRHPKVRVVLHYSGFLLDWFKAEHPEFLKQLKGLVRSGQAEVLGGGYYEPILTMIPRQDALGQLKLMNQTLHQLGLEGKAGVAGMWLAERVWEPELPSLLHQAGIRYTVVDDQHLAQAGVAQEDRFGYYLTEDRGASVAIFPSSKFLRYLVPFKPVEEVMELLKQFRSQRPQVAVLADDGEKFGLWPGTHAWVYQEGWLEAFLGALEQNHDWLTLMTFRECMDTLPPLGKLCLPCGSYEEMTQWSGGFFRNFLIKYPEADTMHKKMLWVSNRLEKLESQTKNPSRGLTQARQHLYMAQSNDAYWHGVFGGLYLRHLRRGVYEHLLAAEKALDQMEKSSSWVRAQALDLDADQEPELLLRSPSLTLLIDTNRGGCLLELSSKETGINLLDTLARRPEPYHERLRAAQAISSSQVHASTPLSIHERQEAVGLDLGDSLVYDPYRRAGWIDHLFSPDSEVNAFAQGALKELGDFVETPYEGRMNRSGDWVQAILTREGQIRLGDSYPLQLTKRIGILPRGHRVQISYRLLNPSTRPLSFLFGSEFNWNLKDAHVNRTGEVEGVRRFAITDPAAHFQVGWAFSKETRLWFFPLETVSNSERGMERTYQGVCLTCLWPLTLAPHGSWTVHWEITLESMDGSP